MDSKTETTKESKVTIYDLEHEEDKASQLKNAGLYKFVDEELGDEDRELLIAQIEAEFQAAKTHLDLKLEEWKNRLKIYNNQKRDPDKVGDPLMFTVHQTLLASLYDDRMTSMFVGKDSGDTEMAESLQDTAEYDYDLMEKDVLDYYWKWNTLFYGRACVLMSEYDRKQLVPKPRVLDPLTLLRDPKASSVNGDLGGRAARFLGWESYVTKAELKAMRSVYKDVDSIIEEGNTGEIFSMAKDAIRARNEAQNRADESISEDFGDNSDVAILEWFTHFKGVKCLVTLDGSRKKIMRYRPLKVGTMFPIIDMACYPMPSDWDGVSISDQTEDKQRIKAVLLNLGIEITREVLIPQYFYDTNKIKNFASLQMNRNTAIPVEGDPNSAAAPMQKAYANLDLFNYINESIDASAQKATSTPELQQGIVSKDARTASELNLVAAKVDTRYSLMAKMFSIAERNFWRLWYAMHKSYMTDFDEKVIRITGETTPSFRKIRRANIIGKVDPDVTIESKILNEAQRIKALNNFMPFFTIVMQDPTTPMASKLYAKRKLAKLLGFKKDEVEMLVPFTAQERRARAENLLLERDIMPKIQETDDDLTHIMEHAKASDAKAKQAHIAAHEMRLSAIEVMQQKEALANGMQTQTPGSQQAAQNSGKTLPSQEAGMQRNNEQATQATQNVIGNI